MFIDFSKDSAASHLKYFSVTNGANVSFTVRTKDHNARDCNRDIIIPLQSLSASQLQKILSFKVEIERLTEELRLNLT